MEIEDDLIVCSSDMCSDSIKFELTSKELIAARDVKHCIMCAGKMDTKPSGKMYCSGAKCKFKIIDTDVEKVTKNLQEYSTNGKMKFCYTCGCSIQDEGRYKICSSQVCRSARFQSNPNDKQLHYSNGRNQVEFNGDTKDHQEWWCKGNRDARATRNLSNWRLNDRKASCRKPGNETDTWQHAIFKPCFKYTITKEDEGQSHKNG